MTEQQYQQQFEDQVKDLITQYLETHGHAPAVTIEWGDNNAQLPTIPISERIKHDIEFDDANEISDPDERSWGMQNGILISKREAQLFVKLLSAQKPASHKPEPSPEPVKHPASEPPDNDRDVWVKQKTGTVIQAYHRKDDYSNYWVVYGIEEWWEIS